MLMASLRPRAAKPGARRPIRHAVFPVAGFGTGLLPATKACPKEMLPIVDRPLIQYAVEEAAVAGCTRMIFVTGRNKRAIEDHFDRAYELEHELAAREDADALRALASAIPAGVTFSYVRQRETTGVVDALLRARSLCGDEPFAVVLPDQLIDAGRPPLAQLVDVFSEQHVSVVGAERVDASARMECLIASDLGTSMVRTACALVKVPPIGAASLPVATAGRFIFTPGIWGALERANRARAGDRSLIGAVRGLMEHERVFACLIDGRRYDCGQRLGLLEAQFAFARKRRELWSGLRRTLVDQLHASGAHEHAAALTSDTPSTAVRAPRDT